MAYTATKYLTVVPYRFPNGLDQTQRSTTLRGQLIDCDTATMYTPGGIGSSSFQVTAFSAVGLVTFSLLKGCPLVNGQRVVVYNTASNTNDGTFTVSNIAYTSATAGTFTAVPTGLNALSGTAQTVQTAEGIGQLQWAARVPVANACTVSSVTFASGVTTYTYTGNTGPQITAGQSITIAGMSNAGNNGTFTVVATKHTSATAGSFTVLNPSGVATDSGTASGSLYNGAEDQAAQQSPNFALIQSALTGWDYCLDLTNYTIRIFTTGSSSGAALVEAALGATVTFDDGLGFIATFPRSNY
jgi:hypothetical protein